MFCSSCGAESADDAKFCGKCGKALAAASGGVSAPVRKSTGVREIPSKAEPVQVTVVQKGGCADIFWFLIKLIFAGIVGLFMLVYCSVSEESKLSSYNARQAELLLSPS